MIVLVKASNLERQNHEESPELSRPNDIASFAGPHMKVRHGPAGAHLFDRATGLNILFDEIQVPSSMWAVAPRQVSIALTNACDLACPYCYAPKKPARLAVAQVAGWLDELDANGCLGVGFGGGEPTLHPSFAEFCQYATTKTGLAVTFTTHGHHLNERLIAALVGNVHFIRISMDGVDETYTLLRGRSFIALRRRLEALHNLAPFGINYVVNARTMTDLDAAIVIAAEVGAVEFLLLPEQPVRGKGGIDHDTARALQSWVNNYSGTVPLTISEAGSDGLPICNPLVAEAGLRTYAHIDATGLLKRSSYDSDGIPIGTGSLLHALQLLQLH